MTMRFHDQLRLAMRLLHRGPGDLAQAAGVDEVRAWSILDGAQVHVTTLQCMLAPLGLQLAIVPAEAA